MQITYLADIRDIKDETVYRRLYEMLPEERQRKTDRMLQEKDRKLAVGAGSLLSLALADYLAGEKGDGQVRRICLDVLSGEVPEVGRKLVLCANPHGKPYIPAYPDFCFNLSHSGSKVMLVSADSPVGCDIQEYDRDTEQIVRRCFSTAEQKLWQQSDDEERVKVFTEIWARKESFLKAVGVGLSVELRSFSVVDERGRFGLVQEKFPGCWKTEAWHLPERYCCSITRQIRETL